MDTEQKTQESKTELAVLMTPQLMEVKIDQALTINKLTLSDCEKRAMAIEINEDNLKKMKDFITDMKRVKDIGIETFKNTKKPHAEAANACDEGKELFLEQWERILNIIKPGYDQKLADVDKRKQEAKKKEAVDKAIKKGIEDTASTFAKKIAAATNLKELSDVERLINLQKSPSMAKKYGDFHAQAIERFDKVLLPVVKSQKIKLKKLLALHGELEEAQSDNEAEEAGKLEVTIGEVSQEIEQNKATAEDILLTQEFFPVVEAEEILPDIRTKRTDISFEIADLVVALKKVPDLLTIGINNKEARKVAAILKEQGAFEGKDELIVDGIKFIVTRQREAL